MKIAIVGSGGVGGFYGAKLVQAGLDVTFVARGAHFEAMRQHGLAIENEKGGINLALPKVNVTNDPLTIKSPDLIIIAVKLWDLEAIAKTLKQIARPDTGVLSLQNGVIKDDILKAVFGDKSVIGGVGYVATHIGRPGVIHQVGALQKIKLGEYDGSKSARVETLVNAFASTGIEASSSDDIQRVLWEKYVFLVGLSALTSVTRLDIGPIRENPRSRGVLQSVIAEAVAVGRLLGVRLPEDYADQCMALIDQLPFTMSSSMYHDLSKGNRLELPWLSGGIVSLAKKVGFPVPANAFIADVLAPYVEGRRG
ncbi:MAG TPA: ketopantoate reductase family protein [Pseudolabrys sp.]|jgi:2-dehydropantoate 2-reductase|nr:ketopantoate reductase family protein [Pseudolabrys sp.]